MNVGSVGRVHQVLDDVEHVGRMVLIPPVDEVPAGFPILFHFRNARWVCQRGIAHPQPYQAIALKDRKTARLRFRRNERLCGDANASAGTVKFQAMIGAPYIPLHADPHRKRNESMRTPVEQGGNPSAGLTKQDDWLTK